MKIEVTERGLKEIYGLKKVDETLTWRQITKKYSKKNIYITSEPYTELEKIFHPQES